MPASYQNLKKSRNSGRFCNSPPVSLAPPVSFRPCRIVLQQLRPVVRVLSAPLLRALQTPLPIHRIGGDLPSVVIVTAPSLTDRVTTSKLSRLKLGWQKCFLAIAAGPFSHEPVLACHGLRLPNGPAWQFSLETHVECVPRPRHWAVLLNYETGGHTALLNRR